MCKEDRAKNELAKVKVPAELEEMVSESKKLNPLFAADGTLTELLSKPDNKIWRSTGKKVISACEHYLEQIDDIADEADCEGEIPGLSPDIQPYLYDDYAEVRQKYPELDKVVGYSHFCFMMQVLNGNKKV